MYYTIEEKRTTTKKQVYLSHSHTIVHPEAFGNVPSCEPRRQPAQACKWFIFKVYISGTFNKMRGNGFINLFLCVPV
ncbi:hypothetical protein I79_004610 [Cricetulus griseus]|uniref:Uncharacterized protein n=1 Tax=Cricetulus griseus TaxID=10029 RepID=G3H305_CRIGR|nr:hypothetical protein I79_004610 [Cricetulus griseus]